MAATLAAVTPAAGQQADPPASNASDRWTIEVAPYLWLAALDGNASVAGIKSDVDVPVQDTLKDLSFGAMLAVDLEKGRFGIGLNGLFARVSRSPPAWPSH
jgi:hypothetical protein